MTLLLTVEIFWLRSFECLFPFFRTISSHMTLFVTIPTSRWTLTSEWCSRSLRSIKTPIWTLTSVACTCDFFLIPPTQISFWWFVTHRSYNFFWPYLLFSQKLSVSKFESFDRLFKTAFITDHFHVYSTRNHALRTC